MFKNTIAKVTALSLIFSLCAPYSLACAQKGGTPFFGRTLSFRNSDIFQEIHNTTLPSADKPALTKLLKDLKEKFPGGFKAINSAEDLCSAILSAKEGSHPSSILFFLIKVVMDKLGRSSEDAFDVAAPVVREIFNMDALDYSTFIMEVAVSRGFSEEEALKFAMEILNEK